MGEQQKEYPVKILCETMQVNRSGYYRYQLQKSGEKRNEETRLLVEVKALHARSEKSYGSRRMAKALQEKGYEVGRYKARSLMRKAQIHCKQRRRFKVTTHSKHELPIAENILNRAFAVSAPNRVWVADITYVWTQEGWLYIAAVLDLFSRRIVGFATAEHLREALVRNALLMAISRRQPLSKVLHHSDRGSQYASMNYQTLLRDSGLTVSMSRKGNCWDNAVMERFFGSLKSERTDQKNYLTREQAKSDVVHYIEMFYNSERLHSTLGYVSPLQYEKNHWASLAN
jgi:putative transposase